MTLDTSIRIGDFCPWNRWEMVAARSRIEDRYFEYGGEYEKDLTTQKIYLYQECLTLRIKHTGLLVWTAVAHIYQAAMRIFRMVTSYPFLYDYSIPKRLVFEIKDTCKLLLTPGLLLSLEISALYGIIFPKEGRKIYASIERLAHRKLGMSGVDLFGRADPYCAPCYQPAFGLIIH